MPPEKQFNIGDTNTNSVPTVENNPPELNQQSNNPQQQVSSVPLSNNTEHKSAYKSENPSKSKLIIILLIILLVISTTAAYFVGKHGQRVVYKLPTPPPVSLPPQAIVVKECVKGFGKQYIEPQNIPNGPIYDVHNGKVIAVEYNYKAVDLFLNPDKLSKTVVPFSKKYQIDSFTTSIGELKAGSIEQAQNVPIHLVMYVVPKSEAQKISCPS